MVSVSRGTGTEDRVVECGDTPYQTIDSGLFYKRPELFSENSRVEFFNFLSMSTSMVRLCSTAFHRCLPTTQGPFSTSKALKSRLKKTRLTPPVMLMDFDCDHVIGSLFLRTPLLKNRALIETTWLGPLSVGSDDYDDQVGRYLLTDLISTPIR